MTPGHEVHGSGAANSTERIIMTRLFAQGDILIERVADAPISGRVIQSADGRWAVVAAGEATGHHHRVFGSVTMYRDDALAREIPAGLYVAHLQVMAPAARLEHEMAASPDCDLGGLSDVVRVGGKRRPKGP